MKKSTQLTTYVVSTTWQNGKVFTDYQSAWKYAEEVYAQTGNVIAVETLYALN